MRLTDDSIELIKKYTAQFAKSKGQNKINSIHMFRGLMRFIKSSTMNDEKLDNFNNSFSNILEKYEVTPQKFNDIFMELYPDAHDGSNEYIELSSTDEINNIMGLLDSEARKNLRQSSYTDLVKIMFSDPHYKIRAIFDLMLNEKCNDFYDELVEIASMATVKEVTSIEEFEKMQGVTNINEYVRNNKIVYIGSDDPLNNLYIALAGRTNANGFLVAEAGVGKTHTVYELANRINNRSVPKFLANKIIYSIDPGSLIAGTKFRGDFEGKLMNIISIAAENKENVILFFDEAHTLKGLGDNEGSNDAMNLIKPYISRGDIQVIMATTSDEYQKFVENDKAFSRRFNKIVIPEPTKEETKEILKGLIELNEKFFELKASDSIIDEVIDTSDKYSLDLANPAKSINLLELAFAEAKVFNKKDEKYVIDTNVMKAVKLRYNIYVSKNKVQDTRDEFKKILLGQDEPLNKILENLQFIEANLTDPEKPLASLLFAGPTGVGKTEAAKIIAKTFCGSEESIIKLNMGEYGSEMDVSKLTGRQKCIASLVLE